MQLEKNMYVRKKNGRIGKIIEVAEYYYLLDIKNSNFEVKCEEKHIKKASHNIIDLIEVGDYVNGERVIGFGTFYYDDGTIERTSLTLDRTVTCLNSEIKSIVTKEQFEQMQYKMGE